MNKRENLLRALRREAPEYVPFDMELCPSHIDAFEKMTGTRDYREYYDFACRFVELNPTKKNYDYSCYYNGSLDGLRPLSWNTEWGVYAKPGSVAHFDEMLHPMQSFTSVEEIKNYPFPDYCEDYRWDGVLERNEKLIADGYAPVAFMEMTIFEVAWYLRGMEELLVDFVENEEFSDCLLDRITDIRIEMAKRYARCKTDMLMLGDDVSTQLDMMMSPDMWRDILKPRMKKIIDAARSEKPDILIFYHGDGNLRRIIPDLIEIGVDVLNPVQPECLSPYETKRLYGDRLSFWGCLGTQTVMPFGKPDEVKEECRKLIEEVGKGGGFVLAPTHVVEPEVPYGNVEAFLEAVQTYGKYGANRSGSAPE